MLAIWRYAPPVDVIIAGLKFRRLDYLGAQLGRQAHAWHRSWQSTHDDPKPEMVVPVPLHWSRRLVRGFNQAALIAAPLAAGLGHCVDTSLRRRRRTPPQTSLDRSARLTNPGDAFVVPPRLKKRVTGKAILLVDDVVTTGATLAGASAALCEAGARHITALALARTE